MLRVVELAPTPGDSVNEWCPQCPVLDSLPSSHKLMPTDSFLNSCLILSSCCLLFSQHYCLLQRTLPSHDMPKIGQVQVRHFCLQECFRFTLLQELLYVFLAVQSTHRILLQQHISNKAMFFLSAFSTVQLCYLYRVIGNVRVWRISLGL